MLQTIKVYQETKERINKYKARGRSYDDVISSFVDYFDSTKIKPTEIDSSPTSVMKKASERMVKIIKNIENKKISRMLIMLDRIYDKVSNEVPEEKIKEGSFNATEVQQLLDRLQEIENESDRYKKQISMLEQQLEEQKTDEKNKDNTNHYKPILDFTKELREKVKNSGLGSDQFKINKNVFERLLQQIDNIVNIK